MLQTLERYLLHEKDLYCSKLKQRSIRIHILQWFYSVDIFVPKNSDWGPELHSRVEKPWKNSFFLSSKKKKIVKGYLCNLHAIFTLSDTRILIVSVTGGFLNHNWNSLCNELGIYFVRFVPKQFETRKSIWSLSMFPVRVFKRGYKNVINNFFSQIEFFQVFDICNFSLFSQSYTKFSKCSTLGKFQDGS